MKTIMTENIFNDRPRKNEKQESINYVKSLIEQARTDARDSDIPKLEKLVQLLNSKKYGLVWEEHAELVEEEMKTKIPVFVEDESKKINDDSDSEDFNFLLEGDNLHSLHLLEKTHLGKIDVIYIDPPYNTGNKDGAFRYNDKFVDSNDTFMHSKWLSFIGNRLRIAQRLLATNGFILISIDDNEQSHLKLLLDEIFGENNFINQFIWQKNSSVKTDKTQYTVNTEYVLLYSKSDSYVLGAVYKPLAETSVKAYSKDDNDGRGKYATVSLQKPRDPGPETTYDYIDNTGKIWPCPAKGWRMIQSKVKALENDGRLYMYGKTLRVKDYWNERENQGKSAVFNRVLKLPQSHKTINWCAA